jgi:putative ABC transport system permease protein
VAGRLYAKVGDTIQLESADSEGADLPGNSRSFRIVGLVATGSSEDNQVFVPLDAAQQLAGLTGKVSLVELSVPGEPKEVEQVMKDLEGNLPGVEARAVRAIVESQGKVVETIRGLLVSLTALILVVVALCVMATMAAIVLERRRDIAVMKALGATDRLVMRLLVSEGAALGMLGGLMGFGVGLVLAHLLGRRLFDVALHPTWWTLPIICLMTVALALAATILPVRVARAVEPATVLKGE